MKTTWSDSIIARIVNVLRTGLNVIAHVLLQFKKGAERFMKKKGLRKSKDNRVIGGVLGGIAEYFDVSPLLVRILFIFFVPSSMPIFLYFILYLVMPNAEDDDGLLDQRDDQEERDAEWSDF